MLTIKEAMKLPALKETKLIAGHSGIDFPIKWVTTVEIIEDTSRFQNGEFLVTTGFGLIENEAYKKRFLKLINEKKLAGVALYTGFYIPEIPSFFIEAANKAGLPLIEIPKTINFSTVTKAILEQIANRQIRLLEDSLSIHKEMTKLALRNDGLQQVLSKLSELTGSSMFVFDDMYQLSAHMKRHKQMQVTESMIYFKDKPFILKHYLENSGTSTNQLHRFKLDEFPCFLTSVQTGEFTYGYLLMVNEKTYSSEMDEVILEHVATLIGIEFMKDYAIEETKVRLQGELVEEILHLQKNDLDENMALRRGLKLGFDLSKNQAVLFAKVKDPGRYSNDQNDWGQHLHYIASQQFSKLDRQYILLPKTDALVALIEVSESSKTVAKQQLKEASERILEHWKFHFQEQLTIGIGKTYKEIEKLSRSGREAEYAVQYSSLLLKKTNIIHFDDLGFYHLLIRVQEAGLSLDHYYQQYLGELVQGKSHRTDLILTLETYLAQNCHIQQTAAKLYIHRHTLKYRLSQIERKTGLSMQSADDRLNLHLAVMAYKFFHTIKS
ncbi:PucR family transcriptional regulator [Alteribacter populi]|uniref:PucR family transcriptional regulator n=1 Tax=Alteribacter populi TaxID=2011011 RepID=UPI0018E1E09E|nr:PucR family transcriptional regulator [Alteribacter populi]